jgi:hypothetical protein
MIARLEYALLAVFAALVIASAATASQGWRRPPDGAVFLAPGAVRPAAGFSDAEPYSAGRQLVKLRQRFSRYGWSAGAVSYDSVNRDLINNGRVPALVLVWRDR